MRLSAGLMAARHLVEPSVSDDATIVNGVLNIKNSARKGSKVTVTATAGRLTAEGIFTVNDYPRAVSAVITGIPEYVETGATLDLAMEVTDQYGTVTRRDDVVWHVTDADNAVVDADGGKVVFTHAGLYAVRATTGDVDAEGVVKVLPVLPNIALKAMASASSSENNGTSPELAVDGDPGTRWGSKHTDDEWFMLDLGADYRISAVNIVWEAAYAADYDIEAAAEADKSRFEVVCEQRGTGGAGPVTHNLDVTARYLRVRCLRRGTAYGYSIIEMEVRGLRADVTDSSLVGLEITGPSQMAEGESAQFTAAAYNFGGKRATVFGTPRACQLSQARNRIWQLDL